MTGARNRFLDLGQINAPAPWEVPDEPPRLPPVSIAPVAELIAVAEASPVCRRLIGLVEWVGTGVPLDPRGRLDATRAREVEQALSLQDEAGPGACGVDLLLRWARAAGLLRTLKGRLVPVKGRAALRHRPLELWQHVLDSFARIADARDGHPRFQPTLWWYWPTMQELVELTLYTAGGGPVPVEMLTEVTLEAPVGMLGFTPWAGLAGRDREDWHAALLDALGLAEALGAVRLGPAPDREHEEKIRELTGRRDADLRVAALTPLGLWAVNNRLVEQGVVAPVVEDMVRSSLAALLRSLDDASPETIEAALAGWIGHRGAARAAREAAKALDEPGVTPGDRAIVLEVFAETGEHGIEAARDARTRGGIGGAAAAAWLLRERPGGPPAAGPTTELTAAEARLAAADTFCALAETGAVEIAFESLPLADQLDLLGESVRSGHPDLAWLLDAVAEAPVHRKLAKLARKERFRLG
ncbi:hypothetical protein LWC33_02750 [Pseudonocardia sp. RS11V-5]|uniref:hypothetical protein n=1 Tax=Pseudonocardia terrae TaxID=2905831 RepID=UPI001E4A1202|nr:hypothetical protein [Pseudonocardia terrae]MCE3550378.1 hypothetical protein [Pseudonocardia terrae]